MFTTQKEKLIKFRFEVIFLLATFIFFSFNIAYASTLNIIPSEGSYNLGQDFSIKIKVYSSGETINAVSGTVNFSSNTLRLNSISKSGSIINFWAQEPSFSNENGSVSFEGVILNGFTLDGGTILTLNFTARSEGLAFVKFNTNSSILANDGQGTNILTSTSGASFNILKARVIEAPKIKPEKLDQVEIVKNIDSIKIEQVEDAGLLSDRAKFKFILPKNIVSNLFTVQIDDGEKISWSSAKTDIFETKNLQDGNHILRATTQDGSGNIISGEILFSIMSNLLITDFSKKINTKENFFIKGKSDAQVQLFIEIKGLENSNSYIYTTSSDDTGNFDFISNEYFDKGIYSVTVYSLPKSGEISIASNPLPLIVSNKSRVSNLFFGYSLLDFIVVILLVLINVAQFIKNQKLNSIIHPKI